MVAVDGTVRSEVALVDESALTGEPLPVTRRRDEPVRSGVVNAGGPFDLLATTDADSSTYASIVRLVREASASTSGFVRVADRYALAFVAVAAPLRWRRGSCPATHVAPSRCSSSPRRAR